VATLVDRWSRKKAIGLMALVWSVFTFVTGLGRSFAGVIFPRTLVGIGEAGFSSGGTAMITAAYPPESRGKALGVFNMAMPLGIVLGVVIGGYLSAHFGGWRTPFYFFAIPGIFLGFGAFFLRDYKTVSVDETGEKAGFIKDAVFLFRIPSLRWIFLGYGAHNFLTTAVLAWTPTLLMRRFSIAEDKAGAIMGGLAFAMVFGVVIGGIVSDAWQKKNRGARMKIAAVTEPFVLLMFVAGYLLIGSGSSSLWPVFLALYTAAGGLWVSAINVATQEVVLPRHKGKAWGITMFFMYLIGAGGPSFVGYISDRLGGGAKGLLIAIVSAGIGGVLACLFFWLSARAYPKDAAKVKDAVLESE
jgi:MFS family permease